jgi:hypothetical protein
MRLLSFLLFFLTSTASALDARFDALFHCGTLGGCRKEAQQVRSLAKSVSGILGAAAKGGGDLSDQALEQAIVEIRAAIDTCHRDILQNCKAPLAEVEKAVEEKTVFFSPQGEPEVFPWTEDAKRLYKDALKSKICAGSVKVESLLALDRIFFSNANCAKLEFLRAIPSLRSAGFDTKQRLCVNGFRGSASDSGTGKQNATFILVNAPVRAGAIITPRGALSQLDDTLVHEFVHQERRTNDSFRLSTDAFLNLGFDKAVSSYQRIAGKLEPALKNELEKVTKIPGLTDAERTKRLRAAYEDAVAKISKELNGARLPMRFGAGTENSALDSGLLVPAKKIVVTRSPTFVNGKADFSENKFITPDTYPLSDKEEYVAVALAMYRYDRQRANRSYSKEELRWLAKNWEYGYLQKP